MAQFAKVGKNVLNIEAIQRVTFSNAHGSAEAFVDVWFGPRDCVRLLGDDIKAMRRLLEERPA